MPSVASTELKSYSFVRTSAGYRTRESMRAQKWLSVSKRQNRMRGNMLAGAKKLGHNSGEALEDGGSDVELLERDENRWVCCVVDG